MILGSPLPRVSFMIFPIKKLKSLVLPSRYEGFPLVLLEAGQYNKPVIASNVSGNPEIIDNKTNGLLFEHEDYNRLSYLMELCIEHPEHAMELGKHLGQCVNSTFNEGQYMQKMTELYRSSYENISNNQSVAVS